MAEAVLIRSEFDPPPPGGMRRAFVLAVLAHVLLILALAWGLRWKKDADTSVEAELWAAVPMQAAPAHRAPSPVPVRATPEPRPVPPEPSPAPKIDAPAPTPPAIDKSAVRDAEIALAQKKEQERIQHELKLREEAERKAQAEKKAAEEARRKEAAAKAEAERKEAEKKKLAEQKRREAEQRKDAEKKAAEDARRKEAAAKAEAKAAEARRKAELDRLTRLAGSSESGQAAQSSASAGPSSGYAARVRGRVKPNITFTEKIAGNPAAEVEVRTSADGTIIASRLVKSSGVKAWDDAVLRAIEKTAKMPRDTDGRVPSPMILEFRPND